MSKKKTDDSNVIASNRKASYNYHITDTYEAGIVLKGAEVKSMRERKVSLKESFAHIKGGELWLEGCHITPFTQASSHEPLDPIRRRKLLLHKKEIQKLIGKTKEEGVTLIPMKLYFKRGNVKVLIGLAKSKKMHDKRAVLKEKTIQRDIQQKWK